MEIFSEIYSSYYSVVSQILNKAHTNQISVQEMNKIIDDNAFSESVLYIIPKLIGGEWDLLEESQGEFSSKLKTEVKLPLTALEKSWLKALLGDKRIRLFLKKEQVKELDNLIKDVDPLFNTTDFYDFDSYSDGDDYSDEGYIDNFRKILAAVKSKSALRITFASGKGNEIVGNYIPCKLQYSGKDDKFRIYAVKIRDGRIRDDITINLGRISKVEFLNEIYSGNIEQHKFKEENQCNEPVIIEIFNERNALERCMLHFSSYDKRTEYDEEKDRYISYIYYNEVEETELLIRILSFGPVIKVLGPDNFLEKVKERVRKQKFLFKDRVQSAEFRV